MRDAEYPLVRAQLEHDAWATRELLGHCGGLSAEEWRRCFEMGPGSLERTLAHIVDSMYFFGDTFAGRPYAVRADFDGGSFAAAELLGHLDRAELELASEVAGVLSAKGLLGVIEFPPGSGRRISAAVGLTQVFNHGTHHRAQCVNMLRRLGKLGGLEVHPLRWAGVDPAES
ncbi:MAG: DinB family protein [Phycisphaerales bacterium]|nr:DinB family protein [Phycisphaerales bacterium]